MKISIDRHEFELKEILLMRDLAKLNISELIMFTETTKNTDNMKISRIMAVYKPLLDSVIINGPNPEDLTFAEYMKLITNEGIINAFKNSMLGVKIPDQKKV